MKWPLHFRARRRSERRARHAARQAPALLAIVVALLLAACRAGGGVGLTAAPASTTSALPTASLTDPTRPIRSTIRDSGTGGVTVEATWLGAQDGGQLAFKLALDTHSVDLSAFDVTTNVVLRDGGGRELAPSGWQDERREGHHRAGVVRFPALAGSAGNRVTLVVRSLAGVDERALTFEFQQ